MSSVLTVSQINTYIKSLVDSDYNLKNLYICGEISNFTNHYRTGHYYFTLKDESASIKAVMFRSNASRIRFTPENGMKVLVRCSISVYERDGIYQLYCEDMQPDGIGELTIAFEQLKQRLSDEGLFSDEHKLPLPEYPARIGVVTSPTGAALQDIINILSRRYPSCQIILAPVQVQGEKAAGQIADAIYEFNKKKAADVLIVGRGGGSIEDLWAFNEETVARAVYDSEIPVISAVGHETDFTICDFVSDLRAPTPSAAAELAAPDYREVLYMADKILDSVYDCVIQKINTYENKVLSFEKCLSDNNPANTIALYSQCVDACEAKINSIMDRRIDFYQNALSHYAAVLESTSPLRVLARGYSIVEDELSMPVKSAKKLKEGDKIQILFSDGNALCAVNSVEVSTETQEEN